MKILRIQRSNHVQERVLVFLEEGNPLRITERELLQFGLYQGMDLSPADVVELQAAAARSELKRRGARLAAGRMLSQKEIADRLTRKGAAPEDAAETVQWLSELGAVDDAAYAGAIARHNAAGGYGAGRVRQELQKRGVPRELWDEALAQMPDSAAAIDRFLHSRLKGRPADRAMLKKLSDSLLRRGFSWTDIRPALNRLGEEIEE